MCCIFRYANDAKNIKNHAHINEDPKDAMLREFQKEIEELRKKLAEGESQTNMHYLCLTCMGLPYAGMYGCA